ncbi:MAG TPA: response regulator [Jatrophihabitans sp.]|nr:response regulator [Jatrophihabitans sp.]
MGEPQATTAGLRVALIAEDDSDIRELVTAKLGSAGFRVIAVADGVSALAAIREQRPTIALLDVMMPGTSGLEVLAELRRDAATAAIPVILLSARSQEFDVQTGIASGASDYIVKPFSPRELLERVELALERAPGG